MGVVMGSCQKHVPEWMLPIFGVAFEKSWLDVMHNLVRRIGQGDQIRFWAYNWIPRIGSL